MRTIIPPFDFPPLETVRERMRPIFEAANPDVPHERLAPRPENMPPEGTPPYPPSEPVITHRGRTIERQGENEWTISSTSPNWSWEFRNVPANPTLEWVVRGKVLVPREGVNPADYHELPQDQLFAMATVPITQHPSLGSNSEDLVDLNGAWWERYPENFYSFDIHSPLTTGEPEGGLGFWGALNVAINWISAVEDAYGVNAPQLLPGSGILRQIQVGHHQTFEISTMPDPSASGPKGVAGELEPDTVADALQAVLDARKLLQEAKTNIPGRRERAQALREEADALDQAAGEDEAKTEAVRVELREQANQLVRILREDEDFPWKG